MRALCLELDDDDATLLFDHLIQYLPKAGANPSIAVAGGVGCGVQARLIDQAIATVASEHDIDLAVRRLPKALRRTMQLDLLWAALSDALSPTCVAVLGLAGRHAHWTVAVDVTPLQIRLYDSDELGRLRRSQCTVAKAIKRISIAPAQVFLITRKPG